MNDAKRFIADFVDERKEEFIAMSTKIWERPELAFREHKSSRVLIDAIKKYGFTVTEGLAGIPSAFRATWGSGRPYIGILGEFDALPALSQEAGCAVKKPVTEGGSGHGCMHNQLGVGSLAAIAAVKSYLETQNLPGTLIYYGCPGEERGYGKVFMARAGEFDELDCALSWHPDDCTSPWTTSTSALNSMDFHFKGRAAHAGRAPHLGRSALDACELMSVGANYLREHIPTTIRLHYGYLSAGNATPNIVQDDACVSYIIRGPKLPDVKEVLVRLIDIAKGAALMTGTELEYEYRDGTNEFVANMTLTKVISQAMQEFGSPPFNEEDRKLAEQFRATIPEDTIRRRDLFFSGLSADEAPEYFASHPLFDRVADLMEASVSVLSSSTDAGAVSYVVPTAQFVMSSRALCTPNHNWMTTAQANTSIANKGMINAAKVLALGTIMIYEGGEELFAAAKAEHKKKTGGTFIAPFPDYIMPDIAD